MKMEGCTKNDNIRQPKYVYVEFQMSCHVLYKIAIRLV